MNIERLKEITGDTGSINDLKKKFLETKLGKTGDINSLTKEYLEQMTNSTGSISDLKGLFSKKFGMDEFDDVLHFAQFDGASSVVKLMAGLVLEGDFCVKVVATPVYDGTYQTIV